MKFSELMLRMLMAGSADKSQIGLEVSSKTFLLSFLFHKDSTGQCFLIIAEDDEAFFRLWMMHYTSPPLDGPVFVAGTRGFSGSLRIKMQEVNININDKLVKRFRDGLTEGKLGKQGGKGGVLINRHASFRGYLDHAFRKVAHARKQPRPERAPLFILQGDSPCGFDHIVTLTLFILSSILGNAWVSVTRCAEGRRGSPPDLAQRFLPF